jgi:ketosteroid isomerase-like protein
MDDRRDFVRGLYDAFAQGDVEAVLAAWHPDIEWNEAEHVTFWPGSAFVGIDAVVQGVLARIPELFGDTFRIDVNRLHQCDDTVIMEGRYTGTAQSTGRDLSAQVVHVWDFRGDKIARFQQYTDTWQFAEVTGIRPVEVAATA